MPNLNLKPNSIILRPRVTEKAAISADKSNVYVFEVAKRANKKSISASIFATYKVRPKGVRLLAIPKKQVSVRGQKGYTGRGRKAYVYLKTGDKIEII